MNDNNMPSLSQLTKDLEFEKYRDRKVATEMLRWLIGHNTVLANQQIQHTLKHGKQHARRIAAFMARNLDAFDDDTITALHSSARSRYPEVRYAASIALVTYGNRSGNTSGLGVALTVCEKAAMNANDFNTRLAALDALNDGWLPAVLDSFVFVTNVTNSDPSAQVVARATAIKAQLRTKALLNTAQPNSNVTDDERVVNALIQDDEPTIVTSQAIVPVSEDVERITKEIFADELFNDEPVFVEDEETATISHVVIPVGVPLAELDESTFDEPAHTMMLIDNDGLFAAIQPESANKNTVKLLMDADGNPAYALCPLPDITIDDIDAFDTSKLMLCHVEDLTPADVYEAEINVFGGDAQDNNQDNNQDNLDYENEVGHPIVAAYDLSIAWVRLQWRRLMDWWREMK